MSLFLQGLGLNMEHLKSLSKAMTLHSNSYRDKISDPLGMMLLSLIFKSFKVLVITQ